MPAVNGEKICLAAYRDVAPPGVVDLVCKLADTVKGKTFLHVNSTRWGGGVAEMLQSLLPLFNDLGLKARWEVLEGVPEFYKVTKSFHNALQGQHQEISEDMYRDYLETNARNAAKLNLEADVAVMHDPQPAALIEQKPKQARWLWRCHIDISRPQRRVWHFLREYVNKYDGAIFSLPGFAQRLKVPQYLIYPSIDPLADKNRDLTEQEIREVLERFQIPPDRPMVLQISRFDRFKDPVGVIRAYKIAKQYNDCILVLAGGGAADDPEGAQVLQEVQNAAASDKDIFILNLPPDSNIEVNALQRAATVIVQKSVKEGFGLTVSEAMWKGKPVIGGFVGGITVQILYGQTGFTVHTPEGCAFQLRYLLNNPGVCQRMGQNAREFARRNFLITRHICDYLSLINALTVTAPT